MRYALLSDVHANKEALAVVLADVDAWGAARVLCAGDIIGYGPDPDACIDLLRDRSTVCVAGNHEGMLLGRLGVRRCVRAGIRAIRWTRDSIRRDSLSFLAALPMRMVVPPDLLLCHGTPCDAEAYVISRAQAEKVFADVARTDPQARLIVCGHTHRRLVYRQGGDWTSANTSVAAIVIPPEGRWLINPGAVGQSRDDRPMACYARYDSDTGELVFRRLAYPHHLTERKSRRVRLVPAVTLPPPPRPLLRPFMRLVTRWELWRTERRIAACSLGE